MTAADPGDAGVRRAAPLGTEAVIALGANLGDRAETLTAALTAIGELPLTTDLRASRAFETVAVTVAGENEDAPRYLNAVALIRTRLAPSLLLQALHGVESAHGRVRRERWGDRTLDLDLISYGQLTSTDPALTLPHPRAAEREFVLTPWLDVDPDAQLPGVGAVRDARERLQDRS
ncbi:2-amino-4-hydroxy-6-hydroxymethyldihydropteridine diphosphokinase [Microbacterium lushaniae]|uniref:2-amino-4-hydroxy-6-hydroxymethyldihydropteridine diphosphokinase n=1 Tax=Microbacterium lushaniae TaxID=2614639 RepID=A0A5J6L0A1_9MICO|nr:2-amino-4-hydroxy-6-hydroxymethyldihydropteridine diphosphokinase [Microbacterium lushaniae]QEW01852.1 2-amino-4-hydroxy-6-hydroxymethyldihydropteridine diphosphokinase [Microbacterium lushaniae]